MKLGIFAKTFAGALANGPEKLFEAIKGYGLTCAHYNMVCSGLQELPLEIPPEKLAEITLCADKFRLEVVGLSATFNMIHPDPKVRETGLTSLEILAASARPMGTDFISLCTGSRHRDKWTWHPDNASPEAWADLLNIMEKALAIAERYQVFLGIEPETGNVVREVQMARRLLDEMASERLKIILDPANLFEQAPNRQQVRDLISNALELLHPHIKVAHAKDRTLDGNIRPAGKGDVDFEFFTHQLKQIGFSGPLVLHGLEVSEVAQSVKYLKDLG